MPLAHNGHVTHIHEWHQQFISLPYQDIYIFYLTTKVTFAKCHLYCFDSLQTNPKIDNLYSCTYFDHEIK